MGLPLDPGRLSWWGESLVRPECVLATADGSIYTADWRGGVVHRAADGRQRLIRGELPSGQPVQPNGIALMADGTFLVAHLGAHDGGVWRLTRDGELTPWLRAVDGVELPPTNFVLSDVQGRVWVTVSTRHRPRAAAYRGDVADGFIVRIDGRGAEIVADGLGYTNEVAIHPDGRWLYVNETFSRCLSRFALRPDGSLGPKEVVVRFGSGTYPDGLAFDEEGHVWVVSIVSNRVLRVAPDGRVVTWLEDCDAAHLAWTEAAWTADTMGREHLDTAAGRCLRNISSIAFSGPDRRTAVLGCLLGDRLATFTAPVPGAMPAHWNHR